MAAPTPDRHATGMSSRETTPNNLYTNLRSVHRDDTPLGPEINNRTHAVPGEHVTPLGRAIVERRRQEAEANTCYGREGCGNYDCLSSDTEGAHTGMESKYTGMTNA